MHYFLTNYFSFTIKNQDSFFSFLFFILLFNVIYLIVSLYNLIFIMAVFNSWITEFLKT